jgi:hypothetical protein
MLKQLLRGFSVVIKNKATDESVTSSTTLQNDDDLFVELGAGETWQARFAIWATHAAGDGCKVAVTVPSGATLRLIARETDSGGQVVNMTTTSGAAISLATENVDATSQFVDLEVVVVNGATAGNLQLQWAQRTSSATATVFVANCSVVARKK